MTESNGGSGNSNTYVPPPSGPRWMAGNKPKNIVPVMIRLFRDFGKYGKVVIFLVIIGLVTNFLSIIGPMYLSDMTDSVSASMKAGIPVDVEYITRLALILVAIYSAAALLQYYMHRTSWITEEKIGDNMRIKLSEKVSRISVGDMDRMRSGDVMSRFVNDTDTIRLRSTDCIVDTMDSLALIFGTLLMMFIVEWRLALALVIPIVAGFVLIRLIVRFSQKYYRAQSRNLGKMNVLVEETFRGLDVMRAYDSIGDARKGFDAINTDQYGISFRARVLSGFMPQITGLINNVSYVVVCIYGSILVVNGEATFGLIVSFIVYVKLIHGPLSRLSEMLASMQEVAAAAERIYEFMDMPEMGEEKDTVPAPAEVRGDVEFEDVCFSYVPGREVIHGFSLSVTAGQKIAIVGPTGAGKTTLSNLLLRFYDPDSGRITIDGIPLTDMRRSDVRNMFGVVLQDTWLFKGTIRENIVFGDDHLTDEDVMEAVDAVGLGQYVSTLSEGIHTYIADPSTLSSGQRQQITIARAMIRKAPLLILDEATSSVDTRTERHIQAAMDELMKGRTSFIIAHRLSTIMEADRILVIRSGSIVENGTHQELLAAGGFYRTLYDSQFEFCD